MILLIRAPIAIGVGSGSGAKVGIMIAELLVWFLVPKWQNLRIAFCHFKEPASTVTDGADLRKWFDKDRQVSNASNQMK